MWRTISFHVGSRNQHRGASVQADAENRSWPCRLLPSPTERNIKAKPDTLLLSVISLSKILLAALRSSAPTWHSRMSCNSEVPPKGCTEGTFVTVMLDLKRLTLFSVLSSPVACAVMQILICALYILTGRSCARHQPDTDLVRHVSVEACGDVLCKTTFCRKVCIVPTAVINREFGHALTHVTTAPNDCQKLNSKARVAFGPRRHAKSEQLHYMEKNCQTVWKRLSPRMPDVSTMYRLFVTACVIPTTDGWQEKTTF